MLADVERQAHCTPRRACSLVTRCVALDASVAALLQTRGVVEGDTCALGSLIINFGEGDHVAYPTRETLSPLAAIDMVTQLSIEEHACHAPRHPQVSLSPNREPEIEQSCVVDRLGQRAVFSSGLCQKS